MATLMSVTPTRWLGNQQCIVSKSHGSKSTSCLRCSPSAMSRSNFQVRLTEGKPVDFTPKGRIQLQSAFLRNSIQSPFHPKELFDDCQQHSQIVMSLKKPAKPLKVIIAGAPASGKGTQCEDIVKKYGLTHISAGDLLRAEVAAGTPDGLRVKEFMDSGNLVPDDVVITIVKNNLSSPAAKEKGWLLDGYPRSASQAAALKAADIEPDIFILLEVPDEILVDRVAGRRSDPVTGKIYHLTYKPPESEEIAHRLTQRSDDTEEKVKTRLASHKANVDSVISTYKDVIKPVDGNRPKDKVFADIDSLLQELLNKPEGETPVSRSTMVTSPATKKAAWVGMPTKLNQIPHGREVRQYFYDDICRGVKNGVDDGIQKLRVDALFPELNPEMDIFRIGTLLELMRELAFTFIEDGKRVKVCVQGSMGKGIFAGMPLQLAGTRRLLELMDWGDEENAKNFIRFGAVGAKEVQQDDDIFIIMAPQNIVGSCILDDLEEMVKVAGTRPVIIVNPRLKDIPGPGGVMQTGGREQRLAFVASFVSCYNFRLLYTSGTQYPIVGSLRMAYPGPYEAFRRVDIDSGAEKYILLETFDIEPSVSEITDAFAGRKKGEAKGFWSFIDRLLF